METPKGRYDVPPPVTRNLKELARPKVVDPITFKPLMKRWLKEMRTPTPRPPRCEPYEAETKLAEVRSTENI